MNIKSTGNPRKDWVYIKLEELKDAIDMDDFNLTGDEQDGIDLKLQEFKRFLDEKYQGT